MTRIHPTAIVDHDANVADDVTIGPYAVVGPDVELAPGVAIGAHVVIERYTRLGRGTSVGVGSVLGSPPQDDKFTGGETWLDIGEDTRIREYATINRGSDASGRTVVGSRCFIMTYVHIAHDCVVEDDVTIANAVQMAGHVHVGHHAWLGGSTPIHQFVRIGAYAFVGGGSRVPQDVPPFARAAGNPIKLFGPNSVGLDRAGFDKDTKSEIHHAFRLLFNSDMTTSEASAALGARSGHVPEVAQLLDFIAQPGRGVLV